MVAFPCSLYTICREVVKAPEGTYQTGVYILKFLIWIFPETGKQTLNSEERPYQQGVRHLPAE